MTDEQANKELARNILLMLTYYSVDGVNDLARSTKLKHEARYIEDVRLLAKALAARERAVRKDYEWILKELVGWGMQTELSDLDLTTAEFSEIWREAQKLLKQAEAVKPIPAPEEGG